MTDSQAHLLSANSKILPNDARYTDLAGRGDRRFAGTPDYIRVAGSTQDVISALEEAVHQGLRVATRSGGHCLEAFVADPAVRVVIDMSQLTNVYYDAAMSAFAIEAGTTLGEAYRKLFLGWGIVLPAGVAPSIGIGGHIAGGAFGFLCRQLGLAADYLYGVEVVVVDDAGRAHSVTATREPSDPNHDLWWAHTGGGGGNFGIVTRYWFRSPDVERGEPSALLPSAPTSILRFKTSWSWNDLDESRFARLVSNHGEWCERNSAADSEYAKLYSTIALARRAHGKIELTGVSTAGDDAERLARNHLGALDHGLGLAAPLETEKTSWLSFALNPFPDLVAAGAEAGFYKLKDALLRKRLTDHQIGVVHSHLTRDYGEPVGGLMGMATYGGMMNTIPPGATASVHRDSVITMSCTASWSRKEDEARHMEWVREFYRDLFSETGGVPAPSDRCDGTFINHPDVDLADPAWNTSGVPWHTLYYKDNYARLQRVKKRWDPRNVFHHALSVQAG